VARPVPAGVRRGNERLSSLIAALLSFLLVGSLAALALIGSGGLPATSPATPRSPLAQEVEASPVEAPAEGPTEGEQSPAEEVPPPATIPAVTGRGTGVVPDLDEPDGGGGGGGNGGGGPGGGEGGQEETGGQETGGQQGGVGEGGPGPGIQPAEGVSTEQQEAKGKGGGNAFGRDKPKGKPASPPDASGAGHTMGKGKGHVPGKGKGHENDAVVTEAEASVPPGQAKGAGKGKD
jgi:hypothetical protein